MRMINICLMTLYSLLLIGAAYADPPRSIFRGHFEPVPSPDGKYVAARGRTHQNPPEDGIWLYTVKEGTWARLTDQCSGELCWLPDGRLLVGDYQRGGSSNVRGRRYQFYLVTLEGKVSYLCNIDSNYGGWKILPDGSGMVAITGEYHDDDLEKVTFRKCSFTSGRWEDLLSFTPNIKHRSYPRLLVQPSKAGILLTCMDNSGDIKKWIFWAEIGRQGVIRTRLLDNPSMVPYDFSSAVRWGAVIFISCNGEIITSRNYAIGTLSDWPDAQGSMLVKGLCIVAPTLLCWSPDGSHVALTGPLIPYTRDRTVLEQFNREFDYYFEKHGVIYHVLNNQGKEITSGKGSASGWCGNDTLLIDEITVGDKTGEIIQHFALQPLAGGKPKEFYSFLMGGR
ncbi:MAG: TolB family protein [Armatimonadota bacterium]